MKPVQIQFDLFASYSQISVFAAGLGTPFNDWEQVHVDQGFAWRADSVSFATLEEAGTVHCEALIRDMWIPFPEAERAIRVPFMVGGNSIEIASISDATVIEVSAVGACALVFETWVDGRFEMQARFTFVPHEGTVAPAVLKADKALKPPTELRMVARPA
jgi:hypothetical protein